MSFSAIADFMRPNFPVDSATETTAGSVFMYRGPTATIAANVPEVGDAWADGLPVTARTHTPRIGNSEQDDLMVDTTYQITTLTLTSTLEQVRYQIRWVPQDLPLIQHPELADIVDDPTALEEVLGWEAEISNTLKSQLKYHDLDSSGSPTGPERIVVTTLAIAYVNLRLLGFLSYSPFHPVLTKISTYRGTAAPGTGDAGGKETPSWPSYPSTYEYIKTGDQAERLGMKPRWDRVEEWTGFKKVYYDNTTIYP